MVYTCEMKKMLKDVVVVVWFCLGFVFVCVSVCVCVFFFFLVASYAGRTTYIFIVTLFECMYKLMDVLGIYLMVVK